SESVRERTQNAELAGLIPRAPRLAVGIDIREVFIGTALVGGERASRCVDRWVLIDGYGYVASPGAYISHPRQETMAKILFNREIQAVVPSRNEFVMRLPAVHLYGQNELRVHWSGKGGGKRIGHVQIWIAEGALWSGQRN